MASGDSEYSRIIHTEHTFTSDVLHVTTLITEGTHGILTADAHGIKDIISHATTTECVEDGTAVDIAALNRDGAITTGETEV